MIAPRTVVRWKVLLFFAGALFFLLGIILDVRPLVIAAIATLAAALLLRFAGRPPRKEIDPSWYEEDEQRGEPKL